MESLAVKYRPSQFKNIVGQESIVKILERQIELKKYAHSMLFCGASGCGKTTMARAFAHKIGCEPIEMDAASNRGIDTIRNIIKVAGERSLDSIYKVYIMDECHALTPESWQALLKLIEEPPEYTIFIFCTTDPQKIPATILNRCMRFNFGRIKPDEIKTRLELIAQYEGLNNYAEACDYISRICNGQMRDAIAMLEKCVTYDNDLKIENVLNALGTYAYDRFFKLINAIIDGDIKTCLIIIEEAYNEGSDLKLFVDRFLNFCLDVNKFVLFGSYKVTALPASMEEELKRATNFKDSDKYYSYIVDRLLTLKNMLKNDVDARSTVEVTFIKLARCQ